MSNQESTPAFEPDTPRGIKRRADGSAAPTPTRTDPAAIATPRRIQALSQDVVNKIAAGEIIVAPVHALKELLENAVDAGSTQLEIVTKDGGLKLLQITDNGCGIHRDDLSLLCERFTTSKLQKFEDLTAIGTYGFRGEALASISHIAHLSVTTKTKDSSCGWKAYYSDGHLVPQKPGQTADPKPSAGRPGTQITVEDLFYNIPTRRRAFRSASEEYAKILDLVGRYAVHCDGVSFSCKKHGESAMGISIPTNATTLERIRQIHGGAVANELLEFKTSSDKWGFKASGWISNANYSVKRTALILFINHRAVESPAIKKAMEQMYSTFLPKGGHPFVYLSLEIEPHRLDVNVHPTKREVHFLHEDEIVDMISDEARTVLGNVDTSRTFMTQTLLPNARVQAIGSANRTQSPNSPNPTNPPYTTPSRTSRTIPGSSKKTPRADNDLVRTDSRERKITSMLPPNTAAGTTNPITPALSRHATTADGTYTIDPGREPTICRLASVKELRSSVRSAMHNELTDTFAGHTFVGVVDCRKRIVAMQAGVRLFLVDYAAVANEYFYQLGLTDFSNFGRIEFDPPLDVRALLVTAAQVEKARALPAESEAVDWEEVVDVGLAKLLEWRAMLAECFSLTISEDGLLSSVPLLVKGYTPPLHKLPNLLLRLGPYVDWSDEENCFHDVLREIAAFYVPESLSLAKSSRANNAPANTAAATDKDGDAVMQEESSDDANVEEDAEIAARRAHVFRALENVLFPAFKARLVATKGLLPSVVEVANLKGLYRVFERC